MARTAWRVTAFTVGYAAAGAASVRLHVGPSPILALNLAAGAAAALVLTLLPHAVPRAGPDAVPADDRHTAVPDAAPDVVRRLLPYLAAVAALTFAVRLLTGLHAMTAALFAAGNVVETVVLAVLVRSYAPGPGATLARRSVSLLGCAGLACAAGALVTAPLLALPGMPHVPAPLPALLWCRVAADTVGMLLAGAVVTTLGRLREVPGRTWAELAGWAVPLAAAAWYGLDGRTARPGALPYLCLAVLLLAVLRLGPVTTATLTPLLVLGVVAGTAAGRTVFVSGGTGTVRTVADLQLFTTVVVLSAWCTAAVTADRAAAVEALRSESRTLVDRVEAQRLTLAHVEELTAHLGRARSFEQVLERLLPRLARIVGADTVRVLLLDEDAKVLVGGGALGLEDELAERTRIPLGTGFAGTVASSGRPWVVDDLRTIDVRSRVLRESGVRSIAAVPLVADGEVVGVLHVGSRRVGAFSPPAVDPVPWLERVAEPIAAAAVRARLAAELERTDARARAALDELLDPVTICRPLHPDEGGPRAGAAAPERPGDGAPPDATDFVVVYANRAAVVWGSVVGAPLAASLERAGLGELLDAYRRTYATGEPAVLDGQRLPPAAGSDVPRYLDIRISRRADELLVTWRDVTAGHAAQDELARRALHDGLTGLANRHLFMDHLRLALRELDRTGGTIALLYLDLDKFKDVNDTYGHAAGDEVIREVGRRLDAAVRGPDTAARFAGDEFAVVARVHDDLDAARLADRLAGTVGRPTVLRGRRVDVLPSIGVTTTSSPHADPDALLREADLAMYQAKRGGRRPWELYDESLHRRAVERLAVHEDLRRALAEDLLRLVYQPVVDLRTGRVVGAEALLRLDHPARGLLTPAAFIDVAEDSDLIVPIGGWVLDEACRQLARWRASPATTRLHLAVNVSGRQAGHGVVREQVRRATSAARVDPSRLVLEITERVLVEAPSVVEDLLSVTDLGCRFAIDDFGTGWSSLAYLKRFPVSIVKIDRSFVEGLGRHGDDTAIVEAVTALARTLDLTSVAEGVETPAQVAELRRLGCHQAQGYHLGRPMSADDVAALAAAGAVRL